MLVILSCEKRFPLKEVDDVCTQMEDINFMKCCYNAFDANNDGKVSMQEASAAHTLSCGENVTSFKGIEYFTRLEKLDLRYSYAESLDLSKNTQLIELTCEGCKFRTIVLPPNPLLTSIHVSGNSITDFDISKCVKLQVLECYQNRNLSSLSIPNSPELITISIWDNNLSSIDVSQIVSLEYFHCQQNNLSVLDISNNLKLRSLACGRQKENKTITVYYSIEQSKLISNCNSSDNSRVSWVPKG
jgi:hypothetical protein